MDRMERGPLPIAAHPVAMVKCSNSGDNNQRYYDTDSDEVDVGYMDLRKNSKIKSINHMMGVNVNVGDSRNVNRMVEDRIFMRNSINNNIPSVIPRVRFGEGRMYADVNPTFVRNSMNEKREGYFGNVGINDDEKEEEEDYVEEEVDEEEDEEDGEGSVGGSELAAEIRGFAERFMRMENQKIEMMKETVRYRMEMEKRRMEMILETQRNLIEKINSVVGPNKKVKVTHEF
ncbi:hypothetical protein K7X08_003432 [Anisodus acutangulus]|uniref:Uncharacterized protein n=1 Tax=Anisodus acutangulus TaxID=402998 RepID=A0A9Q1MJ84_9SOLA|nr:hypothetical protein K7X08_003432 [Anisodus acutangulus]